MLINEVAKRCKITKKAVQYYVEQGLILPEVLENGYKNFSEEDEKLLKQIVLYRKLGLSISDIKRVLEDSNEISTILHQRVLEAEKEKVRQELLKRLVEGEVIYDLECEISNIDSSTIIINRLMEIFPGHYGKLFGLNFAKYLNGKIETEEQMEAFYQIIEFFDEVPDINLPNDLQQYLDEYVEEYFSELGKERFNQIIEEKDKAVRNIDEFLENNREVLEAYQKLKETEEYKNSPAVRLNKYMKKICETNGYYDIFIPAMRKLSPTYNEYYEYMMKANDKLIRMYPEYLNSDL